MILPLTRVDRSDGTRSNDDILSMTFGSRHQTLSSHLSLSMLLLRLEGCICRLSTIRHQSAPLIRPRPQSRSIHQPTASTSTATPTRKGKEVDRWPGWIPTVGLELHVQLRGNVKLLSRQ